MQPVYESFNLDLHQVRYTPYPHKLQVASQQNLEVKGQANALHTVCTILSHMMAVVRYLTPKYGKTGWI